MSNGSSIEVKVDTSAVAAEVSRLQGTLVDVGNHLSGRFVDVGNALHRDNAETHTLIAVLGQKMLDVEAAVNRMAESAAQAEIIRSISEFVGQDIAIGRNAKQVQGQFHKSVERMLDVSRQYDKIDLELLESYHRDVRRTGSHIFELWENQFQKSIEKRMQTTHSSFHETLRRSIDTILRFRERTLDSILETAKDQLQVFMAKRRAFHENVQDKTAEGLTDGDGEVQIAFYWVETQDAKRSIRLGCDVKTNSGGKDVTYTVENSKFFSDLRSQLGDKVGERDRPIQWRQMTDGEIVEMEKQFTVLEKRGDITAEYRKYLCEVLRLYPPQVAEEVSV